MALPDFSMRQLLEAGVHFGHQSHRWNPKMAEYIFGTRNNIHIIDLTQSVPMLHRALQAISDTVAQGGRILFVGTKRQAQDAIADAAKKSAQYYVNSRWLGGTLTNWKTVSNSIRRLRTLDEMLASNEAQGYTKKERLTLQRKISRSRKRAASTCRSPPWSTPTVIRTASPTSCPAMTTPAAPSRSIAILSPRR
jgi:small subunit ribosomal protein S2